LYQPITTKQGLLVTPLISNCYSSLQHLLSLDFTSFQTVEDHKVGRWRLWFLPIFRFSGDISAQTDWQSQVKPQGNQYMIKKTQLWYSWDSNVQQPSIQKVLFINCIKTKQETQTTPARRVPLQKFIAVPLVKKFTTLDGIRRFIMIFQEPAIGPCPQPDQPSPNKFTSISILKI